MAESITVARPYARAAFKFASQHHVLPDWSEMLMLLAAIVDDPAMGELIENPQRTDTQLADTLISIGGDRLNEKCANFVRVLAANWRLGLLPDIAVLFEIERRETEGTVQAEMISAFPVSDAQQSAVAASLQKRLGCEIELTCTIDASLLGGAIIRAGDLVIDGSVQGKLQRLATALAH